jgi:hypothetical protein
MIIHDDLKEYFRLLNANRVDFVLVGAYAVNFHGYVRATKDVDVLYRNSRRNIESLINALRQFGLDSPDLAVKTFSEPGAIIRVGSSPLLIEMINSISALTFEEIWGSRTQGHYDDVPVFFISREHLLVNKRAAGRPKDLLDVEELGG